MFQAFLSGLLLVSACASAQSLATAIMGDYSGRYQCEGQWHAMRLHIAVIAAGRLTATFTFPQGERPPAISLFHLSGTYDAGGKLTLRPLRAAVRGYPLYGMDGTFDPATRRYTGQITDANCAAFELQPVVSARATPPAAPPARPTPAPPSRPAPAPPAPATAAPEPPAPPPPANPREALTTLPACQLTSRQEMEGLLGVNLREPIGAVYEGEQARQFKAARMSSCQFREPQSTNPVEVAFTVTTYATPNPKAILETHQMIETQWRDDHRDVPGIADAAAIWEADAKYWSQYASKRIGRFYVFLGGKTLVQFSISNIATEPGALDLAKKLALRLIGPPAGPAYSYNSKPALPALKKPVLGALPAKPTGADKLLHDLTAKAEAGFRLAQLHLGMLYEYTIGDYPAAAYWYRQAADKGDPESAYCLALLYRDGKGVPKDESTAIQLFSQAGEKGYIPAMRDLAALYLQRGSWSGVGRASEWLAKAADAGDTGSMVLIGYQFQKGIGTLANDVLALQSYQKAAALGNCTAMMNIGGIYFNGSTVSHLPQDAAKAKEWFAKAEACDATDTAGVKAKAAEFRQKAARGELPVFTDSRQTAQPSARGGAGAAGGGSKSSMERSVMAGYATGGALGALFALANAIPDSGGGYNDSTQKMDHELRQIMDRRDRANQQWFDTMRRGGGQALPH